MNNKFDKNTIIKAFEFSSEGIVLTLYIRKIVYKGVLKMFIDADILVNNTEISKNVSNNGSSIYTTLIYKNSSILWIGTNDWKGLRWKNFSNETKFAYYTDLKSMKEKYIEQREFIDIVSNYFYDCIKNYKKIKLVYETSIDEIISNKD